MFSSLLAGLGFLAAYHTSLALAQDLGKPALRDGQAGLSYLDGPFWQYLTPVHATWDQWGWGWIPQACKDRVAGKCNVADVEVFNVHYDDCSPAWVMCRCNNADMSILQMVDMFGRLPVHYRQYARHVVALTDTVRWAYAIDREITFFKDAYIPTVWVHESSHLVDAYAITQPNGAPFSQSQAWLNAINQDPDVPDPYSNTNVAEDFAQVANIAIFDKVVPGGFGSVEPNWNKVFHQYATVQSVLGDRVFPGGFCDFRWEDSPIVSMGANFGPGTVAKKPTFMPRLNGTNAPEPYIETKAPERPLPMISDHWE